MKRDIYNSEYSGSVADIMGMLVKSMWNFLFISIFRKSIIRENNLTFDKKLNMVRMKYLFSII